MNLLSLLCCSNESVPAIGRERGPFCVISQTFRVLVYPEGTVGVMHQTAWKVNSANFGIAAAQRSSKNFRN
jgi:hypothetical protein